MIYSFQPIYLVTKISISKRFIIIYFLFFGKTHASHNNKIILLRSCLYKEKCIDLTKLIDFKSS